MFGIRVEGKAAPGPALGMGNLLSFQRIHVHLVHLLDSLFQASHIEIVESALPENRQRALAAREGQTGLCGWRSILVGQAARDALFQDLNHGGRGSVGRFAAQQVSVWR